MNDQTLRIAAQSASEQQAQQQQLGALRLSIAA